jgi:hypothetical protein
VGTGFEFDRHVRIPADEPPPPAPLQPTEEDLEMDREIEYAFRPFVVYACALHVAEN